MTHRARGAGTDPGNIRVMLSPRSDCRLVEGRHTACRTVRGTPHQRTADAFASGLPVRASKLSGHQQAGISVYPQGVFATDGRRKRETSSAQPPNYETMHCTLSSDDFGDMEWQAICGAPEKRTLARIGPLMENPKAVKSVWGRSYRCGGRAVRASEASSVRFHMSIEASLAAGRTSVTCERLLQSRHRDS